MQYGCDASVDRLTTITTSLEFVLSIRSPSAGIALCSYIWCGVVYDSRPKGLIQLRAQASSLVINGNAGRSQLVSATAEPAAFPQPPYGLSANFFTSPPHPRQQGIAGYGIVFDGLLAASTGLYLLLFHHGPMEGRRQDRNEREGKGNERREYIEG